MIDHEQKERNRRYAGEGKADQVKGKVQNAVGGLKDSLRGK